MLDKLILVFYLNIGSKSPQTRIDTLNRFKDAIMSTPEDEAQMIKYFIPINDGDNRVECLNPPSTCSCNHRSTEKFQLLSDRLDRFDGLMFPITRKVILEKTE